MTCVASGDPTPVVQWTKQGVSYPVGSDLVFSPVSRTDAGFYTCSASNAAGSAVITVYLDVYCEYTQCSNTMCPALHLDD